MVSGKEWAMWKSGEGVSQAVGKASARVLRQDCVWHNWEQQMWQGGEQGRWSPDLIGPCGHGEDLTFYSGWGGPRTGESGGCSEQRRNRIWFHFNRTPLAADREQTITEAREADTSEETPVKAQRELALWARARGGEGTGIGQLPDTGWRESQ